MATVLFGFFLTTLHLVILSQGSLFPLKRNLAEGKSLCTTDVCKQRAGEILSFVDETADPCDDFYLYACGKRRKQGYKGSFLEQKAVVTDRMKDIFTRMPIVDEARKATEKAGVLYQACIDKTHTDEEELAAVMMALEDEKLGAWPLLRNETNPFKSTEDMLLSVGLSGFLRYSTFTASYRNITLFLMISQPDSAVGIPSYLDGPGKQNDITEARISLMTKGAEMLRPDLSGTRLSQWVNATTSFLLPLEKMFKTPLDYTDLVSLTTIKDLESEIPKFPLLKLLNNDLKKLNLTYTDNSEIALFRKHLFTQTMNFILDQDPIDVFNYVGSRAALLFLKISSRKFRAAESSIQKDDTDADTIQSIECFDLLTKLAPDVKTLAYIQKYLNYEKRQQARHILNTIGATYYEELKLSPWMDRKTKDTALKKLWNMSPIVAFTDDVVNETEIEMRYTWVKGISRNITLPRILRKFLQNKYLTVLSMLKQTMQSNYAKYYTYEDVGAYYLMNANKMAILAGILDGIFFQYGLPSYLNLGAIGMIMGHEITHGYDNNGRKFDENGVAANWWTNYTSREFDMKAQCFVEQYGQIFDPLANMTLNGKSTLGENIADNGGLRVAYTTYIRTEYGKPQVTLPGLEKYSPEQLFFISNAMVWCASETVEAIISKIKKTVHSPPKYRVNTPMKNMEEFSAAFQCKPGSRMRLSDGERCMLW